MDVETVLSALLACEKDLTVVGSAAADGLSVKVRGGKLEVEFPEGSAGENKGNYSSSDKGECLL